MRLLYVCNDFGISPDGTKGASVHLRSITRALAELGHDVFLLSPGSGPDDKHPARRLIPPGCPIADKTSRVLRQWLDDHQLEAAAARELRPLMYNACAFGAAMTVLQTAPPHAVIERLALHSCLGWDIAQALDIPYVVEVNALLSEENAQFRSLAMGPLARAIEHRVLCAADAVMAVSQAVADRLTGMGVPADRVCVVPNGADAALFTDSPPRDATREELGFRDACVIGFVGSMKVWHGVDDLVAAFGRVAATHPQTRLLLVGDGPQMAALRDQARCMGLGDRVVFTGAVAHDRIPGLLAAMDVAVAPFKHVNDFYFSPIKLFEYMAAGVCVVASRLGQIEEVIDNGINGLLCPADNVEALTVALQRACATPDLRRQLGLAARAAARRRFTWKRAARSTLRIIEGTRTIRNTAQAAVLRTPSPGKCVGHPS